MMAEESLNKEKVAVLCNALESEQVERTTSKSDRDKFAEAVCAFSNDLSNSGENGYLLIGVKDNGLLSGLKATDEILRNIGELRSNGNILPQPLISVFSYSFDNGDVVVVEVKPSPFPPVRYKGRTFIRTGPRKGVASNMEERRLTEKRTANVSTFDIRPALESSIEQMNIEFFKQKYLPSAVNSEELEQDERTVEEQLASLRFYSPNYKLVTNAGLLLFGSNIKFHFPGAYIQYVRFSGKNNAGDILEDREFSDNLVALLPEMEKFIEYSIVKKRPVPAGVLKEETQFNYPQWAIRELLMNAIMHRDYESNTPVKFYQYDDRIEIVNPGGLYGAARPENFPTVNDYRNPVIAEAMKVLGYVNRFNRGVERVKTELRDNSSPQPRFEYKDITVFKVVVFDAFYEDDKTVDVLIDLIKKYPDKPMRFFADRSGITKKGVEYHFDKLKKKGKLTHKGSPRSGRWIINEE